MTFLPRTGHLRQRDLEGGCVEFSSKNIRNPESCEEPLVFLCSAGVWCEDEVHGVLFQFGNIDLITDFLLESHRKLK